MQLNSVPDGQMRACERRSEQRDVLRYTERKMFESALVCTAGNPSVPLHAEGIAFGQNRYDRKGRN